MPDEKRAFLSSVKWSDVEDLNKALCLIGGYQPGKTSDGYEPARNLWDEHRGELLTIIETAKLCHQCHKLAPFLFLNGNTFVTIARNVLSPGLSHLSTSEQTIIRSALGHYIAGTIRLDELKQIANQLKL